MSIARLWRLLLGDRGSGSASRTAASAPGDVRLGEPLDSDDDPREVAADAPDQSNLPNDFPPYRFVSRLGRGGMGVVYKAEDTRLGRFVALKFLSPEAATDRKALARFRVEARAASSLNHPNICTVYDIGDGPDGTFIAMEWLEGESLRQLLRRGRLSPTQMVRLAIQITEGVEAAHSKGVVHRDVKPENVFVLPRQRIKVLDFGIAKLLWDPVGVRVAPGAAEHSTRTAIETAFSQLGVPIGTYAYMSPEQVRMEEVDARSDLFSLGSVLFEMAAGRRAFEGRQPLEISAAILTHAPQLPADLDQRFRVGLQRILDKAFEKTAAYRYQHASDLVADLKRLERDLAAVQERAVEARFSPTPPRHVTVKAIGGDLLRAALVAAVTFGLYDSFSERASGKYLNQFQLAFIQENVRHGALDQADFEAGGRYLPLVLDISSLHPDKSVPTDRRTLDVLIAELRRHGARAIGIDLSFDELTATDFQYLHRWLALQNVRIGIYKRAVEKREAWLGRVEFADLAAGIALPKDNPQHAFSFSRRFSGSTGGDDLLQLPVALWLISERMRAAADDNRQREDVEARLTRLLTSARDREFSSQLELGTYVIDYSYLKELRQDVIKLDAGGNETDLARRLYHDRARIADRVVFIGDLEDTGDHLCNMPGMEPLPGVLVHASSLATLNRGMLFDTSDAIRPAIAWAIFPVLVALIAGLRVLHASARRLRAWPYEHLELLAFLLIAFAIVFLCRWMAQINGLVWPHFIWPAAALVCYPFAGALYRAVAALAAMIRRPVAASGLEGA
jgi:serine/threonine protein kinase/CHASE2 domain-containing sensor protein